MKVYLAGTITSDKACSDWRIKAEFWLGDHGILTRNPLDGKDLGSIDKLGLTSNIPAPLFVRRDLEDIDWCDVVLANFEEPCPRQSIGTWMELGYAVAKGKPIFLVTNAESVVAHPFVLVLITRVYGSLVSAMKEIVWLDRGKL